MKKMAFSICHTYTQEVLINLFDRKGILRTEEIIEEMKDLKKKRTI